MQPNETLKPRIPEPKPAGTVPEKPFDLDKSDEWVAKVKESITPETEKKTNVLEKLKTSIGDLVSDIVTADRMAKEKFEGKGAFEYTLEGGMTTAIGVGMEAGLNELFDSVLKGDEPLVPRMFNLKLSKESTEQLKKLRTSDPRMYSFITNGVKDLAIAMAYNSAAFFSSRALRPVQSEHLLASLGIDAANAWGTPGLDTQIRTQAAHEDRQAAQLHEAQKAFEEASTKVALNKEEREKYANDMMALIKRRNELTSKKTYLDEKIKKSTNMVEPSSEYKSLLTQIKLIESEMNGILSPTITPVPTVIHNDRSELGVNLEPVESTLKKMLRYSNPPVDLGISMMIDGVATLFKNIKEVQKVRKEKGGLVGKKVEMPKKDKWQPRGERREYGNKPPYNREKVYYGKSQWNSQSKQQEEEERAKLM